jgi:hypothetical protein
MRVNGMVDLEMDMGCRYGQMEPSMKGTGIMEELREMASLRILMAMCMMVNGKMIRPMDMAPTTILTEQHMKVSG